MIKLGITGGIGSGKSYVSALLCELGIEVYDTDSRAKALMVSHPDIRRDLIGLLGEDVYCDGGLNKTLLAAYLFSSPDNARRINDIVHPRVRDDFSRWAAEKEKAGTRLVAMECAILFEADFRSAVDKVIMVSAPLDLRVRRAMRRDGTTEEKVRERVAAQMNDDEKCMLVDFVLINDGSEGLESRLRTILGQLADSL